MLAEDGRVRGVPDPGGPEGGVPGVRGVRLSGTFNKSVRDAALMRMQHPGAVMTNWFAVACELQRDWRNDMEGLAALLGNRLPAYKNLITSFHALTKR